MISQIGVILHPTKATADEYIKVQDDYLNANPVSEYNPGSDTEAENNE